VDGSPSVIPAPSRDPAAVHLEGERIIRGHWMSRSPAPQTWRCWIPVTSTEMTKEGVAGGRPFSADPDDEGSRRSFTTSAGPASPGRLLVYPRRDGASVGTGLGEGDEEGLSG